MVQMDMEPDNFCYMCPKYFCSLPTLTDHLASTDHVRQATRYICRICNTQFSNAWKVRNHAKNLHGEDIDNPVEETGDVEDFGHYLNQKKQIAKLETELRKEEKADLEARGAKAAAERAAKRAADGDETESA